MGFGGEFGLTGASDTGVVLRQNAYQRIRAGYDEVGYDASLWAAAVKRGPWRQSGCRFRKQFGNVNLPNGAALCGLPYASGLQLEPQL